MKQVRLFVQQFYAPLLISFLLLFLVVTSPRIVSFGNNIELSGEISVVGIKVPMEVWVSRIWIFKSLILLGSAISLARALSVNFSKHFPRRLQMDVYFDQRGIKRNLKQFSQAELAEVDLNVNWEHHSQEYFDGVILSLGELWSSKRSDGVPNSSDFSRDMLHARGTTTFVVRRVGLLSYRIEESSGRLDYDWDVPRRPRRSFCTMFELRQSPANHIRPSFWRLVKSPIITLKPELKQVFAMESGGEQAPFDHVVIGLTKINLLPFPGFSDTIYLWRRPDGTSVPIAYCVYIPETETDG